MLWTFTALCYSLLFKTGLFTISRFRKLVWVNKYFGVPVVAQWLTNPTRNHEVAGLIPGLAQWVIKDLALP